MSADLTALLAGTVLAVGALAFVLYPLFFTVTERRHTVTRSPGARDDSAIVALREIEFDRATGKLSETDYAELRKAYAGRAIQELRDAGSAATPATPTLPADPIEARVRAYRMTHRECPSCGLRPEPDAIYCSTCGGYLDRVCPECTSVIPEAGAAFCSSCGATLGGGRPRAIA